ncbi:anti-repressor SinI family protein [Virgibacillus sp. 179-BFC.A HS]|uniref:Anti-repressor SinI family protein n=1 Tax=Tigheibacillus jepli TaxID=3035914 RepID=A0ABU5CD69_9BACI|nr:anti-repressor SinI family protein [Virgibacillus sp. 179-BFC.A HS]MDY0404286.1 anti-repressor SinI family protein [Virgibacillus sp. 179-BFC.A HS]
MKIIAELGGRKLDGEWVQLILQAKEAGLKADEVRTFLQKRAKHKKQISSKKLILHQGKHQGGLYFSFCENTNRLDCSCRYCLQDPHVFSFISLYL